jgi:hypothetical protein
MVKVYGLALSAWDDGLLPGVFPNYNNGYTHARELINNLHDKTMHASWGLFGGLILVAALINLGGVVGRLSAARGLKFSPEQVLFTGTLCVLMLVGYNQLFYVIMTVGDSMAQQIASPEELRAATKEMEQSAQKLNADGSAGDSTSSGDFGLLKVFGQLLFALSGTTLLTSLVIGLSILIYIIGSLFINTLWLIFVVALYIFGPISIVLGVIPGWGGKMISTWLGALVQLSAWQIWMAFCAFCIQIGSELFRIQNGGDLPTVGDLSGSVSSFESAAYALVFAVMYLSTPFIIQGLLPLGRFSVMAGIGVAAAQNQVSNFMSSGQKALQGQGGGSGSSSTRSAPSGAGGRAGSASGAGGGAGAGGAGGAAAGGAAATGVGVPVAATMVAVSAAGSAAGAAGSAAGAAGSAGGGAGGQTP